MIKNQSCLKGGRILQINNIDYCITLYFEDENGDYVKELDFADFREVNRYIRENNNGGYQVNYTFRELIDGKPELPTWDKSLEWKELSEEEMQFQIDDYLCWFAENKAYWDNVEKHSRQLQYCVHFVDYETKKARRHEFSYVCPRCMRELEHCRCKSYPYYLVQIDKLILPIIRELNINGYITTYCCAGHPDIDEPLYIYIRFDKEYHFDMPFPEGGRYSKLWHSISYAPPENMPKEQYAAFQKRVIDELTDWAEMLLPADVFS